MNYVEWTKTAAIERVCFYTTWLLCDNAQFLSPGRILVLLVACFMKLLCS